jgi:diguanylate cyclase (GGDEF)-like protein/PAS domain S-box-containing protein
MGLPDDQDALLLRTVVDLVPAMVGYWDADLRNRVANAAYLGWFGLTPEQMYGKHIRAVIGEELYAQNLPFIEAALAGVTQQFDRTIVDAAGVTRYSHASYVPDIAADGSVRGFSVLVADVTDRVRAERALVEQEQRVAQLSAKLLVVGSLSASLQDLDPDGLQDAVAEAVLAIGFDGAIIVLTDESGAFRPRHGRGIFSVLDGARIARTSAVTSQVLREQLMTYVEDYAAYENALPEVLATGVRSIAAVPIRSGGDVIGVLQAGRGTVCSLADDDREVLNLLAAVAGTTLRHARSFIDLVRSSEELAEQAVRDPLTGLGNRREADRLLAATRPGDALVMFDLDHFKKVNDELGHATGDDVLRALGRLMTEQLRRRDEAVRIGGEEFLLFLPATGSEEAERLVHRLRTAWASVRSSPTFSAGVAVVEEDEPGTSAQKRADAALYAAKDAGRDCIRVAYPSAAATGGLATGG